MLPVAAVGRTAVAVGGIADSGLVFRLTRGRLWIGLLGTLLVGIVGLNVVALSFSASSSGAAHQADELRRMNSALEAQVASLLSADELEKVAQELDLVHPPPGAWNYIKSSPDDAAVAAKRLRDGELTAGAAPPPVTETALAEVPVTDPALATDSALVEDTTVAAVDPATVDPATDPTAAVPAETTQIVAPAVPVGGVPAP